MTEETFPPVKAGDPITAVRANREAKVLNRFAGMRGGEGMSGKHSDSFIQFGVDFSEWVQGVVKVTDVEDSPIYLVRFLHYNFETKEWVEQTRKWRLDASGIETTLSEGEILIAYWDKQRSMFVPISGSGGGGAVQIRFEVLAAGPSLGDLALECDYVVAKVLGVSCQGSGVEVDDEVNIWDADRCHFNIPIDILIGARGRAIQMKNDTEGVVDCLYELEDEGSCKWEVIALCCQEEIYGT